MWEEDIIRRTIFSEDHDCRRVLLDNEKKHNPDEAKRFLERGDSKIVGNFPKNRAAKGDSVWQTDWVSSEQISRRTSRTNIRGKRNSGRSLTSGKGCP